MVCTRVRYHGCMEGDLERKSKHVLAIGILFAVVGILALLIALMQPRVEDERVRSAGDIFDPEYTVEQKADVLATLSASSTGADIPESEKLKVLKSLSEEL